MMSVLLMNKKGSWVVWVSVALVAVLIAMIFYYFVSFKSNSPIVNSNIVNPAEGLSVEQAETTFNESFVYYFLYNVKAYELHNPPLSDSKPSIWMLISDDSYYAEIVNGDISVYKGNPKEYDIIIKTTKKEAVKMMDDKNYIQNSFVAGLSSIELIASKTTLFAKGYVNLYTQITGQGITGNIIRIYTS